MKRTIKERMKSIIEQERGKLNREIEMYQQKMNDTESYYGFGGPYMRQEAAKEKREKQLRELDEFERQLTHTVQLMEIPIYVFGCSHCGCTWFTTMQPFDDWHECPTCRDMIHIANPKQKHIRIEKERGEYWQDALKEALKGEQED